MMDRSLRESVVLLLERWRRLPYSDVERMLQPLERPRFRKVLVDSLQAEGVIEVEWVGDELVLELSEHGRLMAQQLTRPEVGGIP